MPTFATLPYDTASWGRRVLALVVDWLACLAVVLLFVGPASYFATGSPDQWFTLLLFVLESALLTSTVGGSFGKLATRLRVVRVEDGGRVDPLRALARAVLVALVIPPLVFRPDRRGLHDTVAGSATVTLDVLRSRDQVPS
ncbi:RDD family protein [Nocardioides sp.]|uniref:RDD family protein n=1 Tax=Nocardioides sp. TaxID=35761 RepID=UPI003784F98C